MKIGILVAFMVIVVLAISFVSADECTEGQVKQEDCNTCRCLKGNWACTKIGCIHERAIPDRFDVQARQKRDNPVAEDLRDTPCAPNDYFQIDCNVCYCNLDHSGYLCTNNFCHNRQVEDEGETTTIRIPLENNSIIVLSRQGVKLLDNSKFRARIDNTDDFNVIEGGITTEESQMNQTDNPLVYRNQSFRIDNSNQFSCIPGQTFARDCNTCTCTPDGRNAICTLKACDQLPWSRKI